MTELRTIITTLTPLLICDVSAIVVAPASTLHTFVAIIIHGSSVSKILSFFHFPLYPYDSTLICFTRIARCLRRGSSSSSPWMTPYTCTKSRLCPPSCMPSALASSGALAPSSSGRASPLLAMHWDLQSSWYVCRICVARGMQ